MIRHTLSHLSRRGAWALAATLAAALAVAPSASATPTAAADPTVAGTSGGSVVVTSAVAPAGVLTVSGDTKVIGNGTPESCAPSTVAYAVKSGGDISFNCGPDKVTIVLDETMYTCNTHNCKHPYEGGIPVDHMTLDGGGKVTLSGGGKVGIFYANACEETMGWLSGHCNDEVTPHVTFRNLGFRDGNASSGVPGKDSVGGGGGGGAIAMRGGHLTVEHSSFYGNRCMSSHREAGGGAIRVVLQPTVAGIRDSYFKSNYCANGGAVSALAASLFIVDSKITGNSAVGEGAWWGGGGNGGGVYFDGDGLSVKVVRSIISFNKANEGGTGIFFNSDDRNSRLYVKDSRIVANPGGSFFTDPYQDVFYLGASTPWVRRSVID